jgi:putative transposase
VSSRVSPTDRLRAEIDALFTGERDLVEVLEDVARLGARLLIQTAVEAEVAEFLGRARYQRAATAAQAQPGHRNGHCPTTIKTTTGPVTVHRPKLRGTSERFASRLFGTGVTKTNALESLVIAGFVRGLSVRDVEQTLADALGAEATLSKSTVSRVCEAIKTEFDAWRERRLDDVELDYLFLDGSCFRMHAGARAEPVLAAWGITTMGKPVLVGLAPGGSESTDAWSGFLDDLGDRGLRPPLLVISDGAGGLINAAETVLARSLRQRCLIHRARNVLAKVPTSAQASSRPPTGRSSRPTTWTPTPASSWWTRSRPASMPSPVATAHAIQPRCAACSPTGPSSPPTCASPQSTTTASATPTSSSGPSARPADA